MAEMNDEQDQQVLVLRVDSVSWRAVGDELVILDVRTGIYLTLNGTARVLWEQMVAGASRTALVEVVVQRWGVSPRRAESDVDAFLTDLVSRDLVEPL